MRYWSAPVTLQYVIPSIRSGPPVALSLELVSMEVFIGLHAKILARSKVSLAYCDSDKNTLVAERVAVILR